MINSQQGKGSQRRCSWVCLAVLCIVVASLAGGAVFYFKQIAPTNSVKNETNVHDAPSASDQHLDKRFGKRVPFPYSQFGINVTFAAKSKNTSHKLIFSSH